MRRRYVPLASMVTAISVATLLSLMIEAGGLATWAQRLPVGGVRDVAMEFTGSLTSISNRLGLGQPRAWALAQREIWSARLFPEPQAPVASEPARIDPGITAGIDVPAREVALQKPIVSAEQAVGVPSQPVVSADPAKVDASAVEAHQTARQARIASVEPTDHALPQPETNLKIALVGDSMMAVGLAPVLQRNMPKDRGYFLIRAYRSGTGLVRPDVFDWMVQYPRLLKNAKPDIVICAIGANDAQNVQSEAGVLQFNSPAWNENYAARVRSFAEMLAADGTQVLWIGMPEMREPRFSRRMSALNDLVRNTVAGLPGVSWLDPNPWITDPSGHFLQFGVDGNGRQVKLRADDGIHIHEGGARMIAPEVLDWVRQRATSS